MANLNANQKKLYHLSLKYNEDPAKWLAIYEIESTSGKNMKASSGATGHFQIMPQFYKDYGVTRDETMDLEKSFLAVRQHHARHSAQLRAKLGRELTAGEYYLGHQQGWTGATALLSHPKDNVVDALATVMSRKKAENSVKQNGGKTSMTAEQFANMWIKRADGLQEKYNNQGYGTEKVRQILSDYLSQLDLTCITECDLSSFLHIDPIKHKLRNNIDHICISNTFIRKVKGYQVGAWDHFTEQGKYMSDHNGVFVSFEI